MDAVERGVSIFQTLATEGVGGVWELLLNKLGDIKEMILDKVKDFVVTQIIKAGIVWLIGLLNPASAFIKACKAIYDVVMFFIEKGKQIADFVNAVLDSLAAIASGQLGGVVPRWSTSRQDGAGRHRLPREPARPRRHRQKIQEIVAEDPGAGEQGDRLRDQDRPQARRPDHPRHLGHRGKVKAKVAAGKAYVKGKAEAGKEWVRKGHGGRGKIKERFRGGPRRARWRSHQSRSVSMSRYGSNRRSWASRRAPRAIGRCARRRRPRRRTSSGSTNPSCVPASDCR